MSEVWSEMFNAAAPVLRLVGVCIVLGVVTAIGTEAIGGLMEPTPRRKVLKRRLKFGVAIVIGMSAYGAGYMPIPEVVPEGPVAVASGWMLAAMLSWLCAFGVGQVHDRTTILDVLRIGKQKT